MEKNDLLNSFFGKLCYDLPKSEVLTTFRLQPIILFQLPRKVNIYNCRFITDV